MILTDAGPLVALVHAGDRNHKRCVAATRALEGPMATVWPALTEAMYLLRFSWPAQRALWSMLEAGALRLLPLDEADTSRIAELMGKYRDLPMDLADASLVRVTEREKLSRVFTLDRREFSLYRPLRIGRFAIVP